MAEKTQNKKNKKTKKTVSEQVVEVVSVESPKVTDADLTNDDSEDEVLNEIENQVQVGKMEEHIIKTDEEELKSVENSSNTTREDPFLNESESSAQQMLTANVPKKKVKRQVMISFDEWNGTYIM